MKTNTSENEQGQIRRLAFEALTEYPDGRAPVSLEARSLYPEIYQSPRAKSSDKKKAEDALRLLKDADRHRASLQSWISAAAGQEASASLEKFPMSLIRLGLYEVLEGDNAAQDVFRDYLGLYKSHLAQRRGGKAILSENEAGRLEALERVLFAALFAASQFFIWQALQEAGSDSIISPAMLRKLAGKMGYDEEYPAPDFALQLARGILAHKELLDAGIEKFFKPRRWSALPSAFRNILRMGLYENLIGLASPEAIKDSLEALLVLLSQHDEELKGEAEQQTSKFIDTQLVKSARSIGRALAFQIIYSLAFTNIGSLAQLRDAYALSPYNISGSADTVEKGEDVYSWKLVRGVWENVKSLDEIIDKYSHKWRVERMGKIEITLLRLALYEMIYGHVPAKIVISEIMDIADMFGAEAAKNLVNGILDAVSKSDEYHFIVKKGDAVQTSE